MGAFAFYKQWLEKAYDGVSLGEMVQWSDLIASMYVLGHNITLSAEQDTINRYFSTLSIKTYNDQWANILVTSGYFRFPRPLKKMADKRGKNSRKVSKVETRNLTETLSRILLPYHPGQT